MIHLKEKAEPEAVDALTVCDDLRRAGRAREGGRRGLRALAADRRAGGRGGHRLRAHRPRPRAPAKHPRRHARDPGRVARPPRRAARADRARRGGAVQDRPRRRHARRCDRSRRSSTRRSTSSRSSRARRRRAHGHAVRLRRPRRAHGRIPARQPDRARRSPLDGKERGRHEHRRVRGGGAGVPVALFSLEMSETELAHRFLASQARVSSDDLRKGRVRAEKLAEGAEGGREARPRADLRRRLERHERARDAREVAPAGRPPRPRPGRRGLPPARCGPRAGRTAAASSRSARSAAGSRSSPASSRCR